MRLCRFDDDRLGIVRNGLVHDVNAALDLLPRRRWPYPLGDELIAHLPEIRDAAERLLLTAPSRPVGEVRLRSPVANPSKIVCAPVNYRAHVEESNADAQITLGKTALPIDTAGLFLKACSALVGPADGVRLNFPERRTDHEAEVAVVIGTAARDVSEADALGHVAGYCLALDMTMRGSEDRSFRKSCDSYAVLGPWLVTADEVAEPGNLPIGIRVNGNTRQSSNTGRLLRSIPFLIAWASRFYTLLPGDVLMTGTPEGVGPVAVGDVLEVDGGPLGTMTTRILG